MREALEAAVQASCCCGEMYQHQVDLANPTDDWTAVQRIRQIVDEPEVASWDRLQRVRKMIDDYMASLDDARTDAELADWNRQQAERQRRELDQAEADFAYENQHRR